MQREAGPGPRQGYRHPADGQIPKERLASKFRSIMPVRTTTSRHIPLLIDEPSAGELGAQVRWGSETKELS